MTALRATAKHHEYIYWAVLAILLSGFRLGDKSLWDDEGFSASAAELSWGDLATLSIDRDPHTALWHALLKIWVSVFGTSEVALRSLSVAMAIAVAVALWLLARRLFGPKAAHVATLCFLASETFLRFAQDARPGMLTALLVTLSITFLVKAVRGGGLSWWIAWGIAGGLSLYGHPFAVFVPVAAALSLILSPPGTIRLRRLLASASAFLLTILPLAILLVSQRSSDNISWIPELSPRTVATGVFLLGGGGWTLTALPLLVAFAAFAVLVVRRARNNVRGEQTWPMVLVLLWAVTLPVALVVMSLVFPTFVPKYLFPAFPAVALGAGYAVSKIKSPRFFICTVGLLVVSGVLSLAHWYAIEDRDDWRDAAKIVSAESNPDEVLIGLGHRAVVDYYVDDFADTSGLEPVAPTRPFGSPIPPHEASLDQISDNAVEDLRGATGAWLFRLKDDEVPVQLENELEMQFGDPAVFDLEGNAVLLHYTDEDVKL